MESQLVQYGVLGIFCAWLMWRVESRLDAIREGVGDEMGDVRASVDRLTKAQLLAVIAQADAAETIKAQAKSLLDELGAAEARGRAEVGR